MINLNWQQFVEKYSPIKNTFVKDAACDGHLFQETNHLKDIPKNKIWTLLDNNDGEDMFIANGLWFINALGYIVAREEYALEEKTEVRLEDGYEIKE